MKTFFKVLMAILGIAYPIIIFTCLVIFKLPVRIISLCVIVLGAALFISITGSQKEGQKFDFKPMLSCFLFLTAGIVCFITQKVIFLKLYSVVISAVFLFLFGSTLFFEPNMIFRFATLADKTIKGSNYEEPVKKYCKKVTVIWCIFFIINGTISVFTAFADKLIPGVDSELANTIWSVYNGGISYVLMGLLFLIEFIVRHFVNKKIMQKYAPEKLNK